MNSKSNIFKKKLWGSWLFFAIVGIVITIALITIGTNLKDAITTNSLLTFLTKTILLVTLGSAALWVVIARYTLPVKRKSTQVLFPRSYHLCKNDKNEGFRKSIRWRTKKKNEATISASLMNIENKLDQQASILPLTDAVEPSDISDEINIQRAQMSTHPNPYTDYLLHDVKNDMAILKKPKGGSWEYRVSLQNLADRPSALNKKVGKIVRLIRTDDCKFDIKVASKNRREPVKAHKKERPLH